MNVGVEGTLPTEEQPVFDAGWVANKLARVDFKQDAILEHMRNGMESRPDRGPEDYDKGDEVLNEFMRNMNRLMSQRGNSYNNGDGGDEDKAIKRWHLGIAVVTLMFLVIGAAWRLSEQMTSQIGEVKQAQASQTATTQDIREHQREQDDRSTRIEQELQLISARTRVAGAP